MAQGTQEQIDQLRGKVKELRDSMLAVLEAIKVIQELLKSHHTKLYGRPPDGGHDDVIRGRVHDE